MSVDREGVWKAGERSPTRVMVLLVDIYPILCLIRSVSRVMIAIKPVLHGPLERLEKCSQNTEKHSSKNLSKIK